MQSGSTDLSVDGREARVLRAAFLTGAIADAGALLPMLVPSLFLGGLAREATP